MHGIESKRENYNDNVFHFFSILRGRVDFPGVRSHVRVLGDSRRE